MRGSGRTARGSAFPVGSGFSWTYPATTPTWRIILPRREREAVDGRRDGNSGGSLLWFSPGGRVTIGGRVSLGLSVGIPIAEDLNGDQVTPSWRIVSSAGLVF